MSSVTVEKILVVEAMAKWRNDSERGKQNYTETSLPYYHFVCHRFTAFGLVQFPGLLGEDH